MVKGLFSFNERVVLQGQWAHGYFTYTAIGAYNVGSIFMRCCPDVITNQTFARQPSSRSLGPVDIAKGEEVGAFKLGSSIALIFEAPDVSGVHVWVRVWVYVACFLFWGVGVDDATAHDATTPRRHDATTPRRHRSRRHRSRRHSSRRHSSRRHRLLPHRRSTAFAWSPAKRCRLARRSCRGRGRVSEPKLSACVSCAAAGENSTARRPSRVLPMASGQRVILSSRRAAFFS